MLSPEAQALLPELRAARKKGARDLVADRAEAHALALADPPPADAMISAQPMAGVPCERVAAATAGEDALVVFLHGGAYVNLSAFTFRRFASLVSAASGLPVLVPDYRLAPEHPYPAAVEDAVAVLEALWAGGQQPARTVLFGDSAGGGLALATMLALRDRGSALPAAAVLLSPWTDILARGDSYVANLLADPTMDPDRLRDAGRLYTGASDPLDPLISPIEADLHGLPPLLIQVGGAEVMLDDSTVLAERARAAGVEATCEICDGMWHVFQNRAPHLPEAVAALDRAGAFLRRHLP